MSHADFVHLHLHTEYSLLDGACRLDRLVDKAHELKFATGSAQANVSKHLALLAHGGILERKKDGQRVYYGMKDRLVMRLCDQIRTRIKA